MRPAISGTIKRPWKALVSSVPILMVDHNSLDTILALIKQLESTRLGLKQLRGYVGSDLGEQMLQLLIEEGDTSLAEIKRKLIQ